MSKIALDLAKFKHVKTKDGMTTLRHRDGHELTVAHKSLSPEFQAQLEAIHKAYGGSTTPTPQLDPDKAAAAQKGAQSGGPSSLSEVGHNILKGVGLEADPKFDKEHANDKAKGGRVDKKVEGLAHGGQPSGPSAPAQGKDHNADFAQYSQEREEANYAVNHSLPCQNPSCKSHGKPHPNCRCYSAAGELFAEGGKVNVKHVCEMKTSHYPDCEYYAEGDMVTDSDKGESPSDQRPIPETEKRTKERAVPDYQAMTDEAVNAAAENPTGHPENIVQQGNKIQERMETDAQQADQQESPDQVNAPQESPNQDTTINAKQRTLEGKNPDVMSDPVARNAYFRQYIKDDMVNHSQEWEQDLRNGHITPETYSSLFAKQDTLGKIGTMFGMLLSGAGSGLSHQPNMVMQMMDNQITRDLDAQKTSKANATNYLRLSQQHEMNRANISQLNADTAIKSYALAQSRMLQSSFHDLVNKTNAMPEGPQKEAAKNTLGMMYQQMGAKINNIQDAAAAGAAYYKMLGLNNAQQGASTAQQRRSQAIIGSPNPFATASQWDTEHTIPGVQGYSEQASTPQDRDQIQAMNILDNKVKDVLAFAQQHKGTLNPSTIAQAKQKAEELTAFYNRSVDSGIMTPGRMSWLEEQIKKNPTSIIQQILGNNARLAEIRDSNANRRDQILHDKLGFPKQTAQQSQQEPPTQNKPVPTGYQRQIINGRSYFVPVK